jgi:hypothetical protein
MPTIPVSTITLTVQNMTKQEIDTLRDILLLLVEHGVHRARNGRLILYFNKHGLIQIGANEIIWKKECNNIQESSS